MTYKLFRRIIGSIVFLASAIVLFMTVQPSVSFWDAGERIAASFYLQIPHPPGTPFFILLGKIFSMIPFVENVGLRVNTISVLAGAFSVLFLYLVAVRLIEDYRGKEYKNLLDAAGTYIAAAIGALSFSYSNTFWFVAVEAEVYSMSLFLFTFIVWMMMVWYDKADNKDSEKYILMIAYLVGLAAGVHLMSVLAIMPVVMVIIFRKYIKDYEECKKTGLIFLGHVALLLIISIALWANETGTTAPELEDYQAFDNKFKVIFVIFSLIYLGVFWKKIFTRNSFYFPVIAGGVVLALTFPGIFKYYPTLVSSFANNYSTGLLILLVTFGVLGFIAYYTAKNKHQTIYFISVSIILMLLGFTTYAMVIIRANQDPPMNQNDPSDFTTLVSYLNREQYGDFPTFKRRYATEGHQQGVYTNYTSDLDFWWRYQMHHMFTRYLMWSYAGRESWDQDAGVNIWPINQVASIIFKPLGLKFDGQARDSLFGIPLLLGILGLIFHFRRDWKLASVFFVMFILMGYLTAFYQNQQQPQPRERDYFYIGAFFVYSIWVAIGVRGIIDLLLNKVKESSASSAVTAGALALFFILVPVNMLFSNYFTHDRSKNWVPWDYSYNLLQSCAPNAILFTNGDNDTFPLWYLQDVEGIRRDVRVANLSLLNTSWYIRQLKNNEPYGAEKIAMRYSDDQVERIRPVQWEPQDITIPVPSFAYEDVGITDTALINSGNITFRLNNTLTFGNIKAIRVQDLVAREIIESNKWERPIYFAVTCAEDSKIGLNDFLKMEGMALRLVPEKRMQNVEFINEPVLRKQLFEENPGFSIDYEPGFKFRGLNDPSIFFDENHVRLTQNYRNSFIRLALYYVNTDQKEKTIETLDLMDEKMPRSLITMDYRLLFDLGNLYFISGAMDRYKVIASEVEEIALKRLEEDPLEVGSYYNPYRLLTETYENLGEYRKAAGIIQKLQELYPDDPGVKRELERFQQLTQGETIE